MPYVSRDGALVFVPADASLAPDRVAVNFTSAGSKRSIAMLKQLGKGSSLHEAIETGGRGGSSSLDHDLAAPNRSDANVHAAPLRRAGGGQVVVAHKVGSIAPMHGADSDEGGETGAEGSVLVMPSPESREGAPPVEGDAPSNAARVSFAGGMHLHINTQSEQVSMAVWLARGYEDRLCKLLVDMCVAEGGVSQQAPMDMVGVLSCPPHSFGRHTSLLVSRACSILQELSLVWGCLS